MNLEEIRNEIRNADVKDLRHAILLLVSYLEEFEKEIGARVEITESKSTKSQPKTLAKVGVKKKKRAVAP